MIAHVADASRGHWFEEVAEFLGPAYLRYSFTKGTAQEVAFLVDALDLRPGSKVLDVGCGPGRHAHALAAGHGVVVHGVDISARFVELARENTPAGAPATFEVADARHLAFDDEFDVAISLCQGAFGLAGDDDGAVLDGMRRAVRAGGGGSDAGKVAFTAFSAYFLVRDLEQHDAFDADTGVNTEHTELRNEHGETQQATLRTTCFTPKELRLLCRQAGLAPEHVWSVTPGAYARTQPTVDSPEFLVVARRVPL